ncbi:hypothetical protein U6B65_09760 [Oscillospiraceae bacterium MB08-C2-2]|nr:hypothetical protein U6B65_09760 [Oscillospiraceae bacterium MB08-C2-2]
MFSLHRAYAAQAMTFFLAEKESHQRKKHPLAAGSCSLPPPKVRASQKPIVANKQEPVSQSIARKIPASFI